MENTGVTIAETPDIEKAETQIANMDEYDFWSMLLEARIVS